MTQVRTGRPYLLEVEVEGANHRHLRLRVRDRTPVGRWEEPPGRAFLLRSADLPEAFRVPLEGLVLREALERWVGPEDQAALLTGADTLEGVLARALAHAVRALGPPVPDGPPDPSTVERVRELALLHARRGLSIPFDAQTEYYRIYEAAPPSRRSALAPLREPMGFLPDS